MPRFPRISARLAILLFALAAPSLAGTFSTRPSTLPMPPHGPTGLAFCGPTTVTESSAFTVTAGNSTSCNQGGFHDDNSYWRAFNLSPDFGITTEFHVCQVTIGVEAASTVGGSQPITVNLYTSDQAFPTGFPGSLTLIGSTDTTVADQSLSLLTIPVSGTAPTGSQLVVEVFTPSGIADLNSFYVGSNANAETAPSYLSAPACGVTTPTATADLLPPPGFPNMHIVMIVDGTASGPAALAVNPPSFDATGNGVFELNELATVAPSWTNGGTTDIIETGTATGLSWIGGLVPITDSIADYGTVFAGTTQQCTNCYQIEIDGTRILGQHLDAHMQETINAVFARPDDTLAKTWTIHIGGSFGDVSTDVVADPYYPSIETIFHNGVTAGCQDGTLFCPTDIATRAQMAVFLLKASLGSGYTPPPCATIFTDVPCPATPGFPYSDWIEDLYGRNITAGCQAPGDPLAYCPDSNVLRQEMAVFLLKASLGSGYTPPACTSIFSDVPCPATPAFPYSDFIEDLHTRGITAGCQAPLDPLAFCPGANVLRQEMAVFLTRTFGLVLYGP